MVLYYILVPLAWLVWHIGFRIRVEGRENLKKVQTKGYILAPTHVCSSLSPGGAGGWWCSPKRNCSRSTPS